MKKVVRLAAGLSCWVIFNSGTQARADVAVPSVGDPSLDADASVDALAAPDRALATYQSASAPVGQPASIPRPVAAPETIDPSHPMAQVRSVAELSDVRPSDWAYGALQSLIERYGLVLGYPDGAFRGNQTLSRDEFAAAIAQVIESIIIQLRTAPFNQIIEDYRTVRQLAANYTDISTDLRQRLDRLTAATLELERRQFSPTTRLSAQVAAGITDGTDASGTLVHRLRINLQTSFGGRDRLVTQFEAGNAGNDAIARAQTRGLNRLGTNGTIAAGGGLEYVGAESQPRVRSLYYAFQPSDRLSVTVGPKIAPGDFIDHNRFANPSLTNFSASFFMHNPLIVQNAINRESGAGAVVMWQPLPELTLRALYVAADAGRPAQGLFNDRNQASAELQYDFNRDVTLRLQYTHARVNETTITAGGINAEWALNSKFAVFGRFGFGRYSGNNSVLDRSVNFQPKTWQLGFVVRQLIIPGSMAGVAIGQPFVERDLGNATQTNFEAFYRFLLNDNVSFSPSVMVVTNPDNQRASTVWQWAIQMVFSF